MPVPQKVPTYDDAPYCMAVMGAAGVGKTALIMRAVTGQFVPRYDPTIEDDFRHDTILPNSRTGALHLLDTGGSPDLDPALRESWIARCRCFVLVYSITSRASMEYACDLRRRIVAVHGSQAVIVLVSNKADREHQREVLTGEGRRTAKSWGCPFFEVSAMDDNAQHAQCFTAVVAMVTRPSPPRRRWPRFDRLLRVLGRA
ncbi:hypothetical protein PBRA_007122 [Plasmodiophora brassicae]|nr:hypothetical protein PBRA_007122 [Plasmodiophora brassicae]